MLTNFLKHYFHDMSIFKNAKCLSIPLQHILNGQPHRENKGRDHQRQTGMFLKQLQTFLKPIKRICMLILPA